MARDRKIAEDLRLAIGYLLLGWVVGILPCPEKKLFIVRVGQFFDDSEPVELARQAARKGARNG
jgi:hypothetical protein